MKRSPAALALFISSLASIAPLAAQIRTPEQSLIQFTKAGGYRDGPIANHPDWSVFTPQQEDAGTFTVSESGEDGMLVVDPTDSGLQMLSYEGPGKEFRGEEVYAEVIFSLKFGEGTSSVLSYGASVLPNYLFQNAEDRKKSLSFGLRHVGPLAKDPQNGNVFNLFVKNTYGGEKAMALSPRIDGKELGLSIGKDGAWEDGESDVLTLRYAIRFDKAAGTLTETVTLLGASKIIAESTQTVDGPDAVEFPKAAHLFRFFPHNMNNEEVAVRIKSMRLFTR